MKSIKLYRILINRFSKEKHKKILAKKKTQLLNLVINEEKRFQKEFVNFVTKDWAQYECNYVVGFVDVYYENNSIYLDLYLSDYKGSRYFSNRKKIIKPTTMNGNHFYINNHITNLEIYNGIQIILNSLKNSHDDLFFDVEYFNTTGPYIDYLKLIKNAEK